MGTATRQIVAFGGGGFSMESGNPLLDDYVLGLSAAARPRVCFLPSASGDADHYIVRFYRAFPADRCEASHISLFRREQGPADLRAHLLSQDLIYVGGGSVLSLLGVWRAHGIDEILREAWEAGVVLCGLSAGSLCWFAEAVTGFHGAPRRVEGLGLLPFSNCVHYERDSSRRRAYGDFLRAGMRPGYAAEDGAALHFVGEELRRVVASRPNARGYRLDATGERVVEMRLATTYLGEEGDRVRSQLRMAPQEANAVAA
jgi:peptidase E